MAAAEAASPTLQDSDENRAAVDRNIDEHFTKGQRFTIDSSQFSPALKNYAISRLKDRASDELVTDDQTGAHLPISSYLSDRWTKQDAEEGKMTVPAHDPSLFPFKIGRSLREAGKTALDVAFNYQVPGLKQIVNPVADVIEAGGKKMLGGKNIPIPAYPGAFDPFPSSAIGTAIGPDQVRPGMGTDERGRSDVRLANFPAEALSNFAAANVRMAATPAFLASLPIPGGLATRLGMEGMAGKTLAEMATAPIGEAAQEGVRAAMQLPEGNVVRKAVEFFPGKFYPRVLLPSDESAQALLDARMARGAGREEAASMMKRLTEFSPEEQTTIGKLVEQGFVDDPKVHAALIKKYDPSPDVIGAALDIVQGTSKHLQGMQETGLLKGPGLGKKYLGPRMYLEKAAPDLVRTLPATSRNPAKLGVRELGRLRARATEEIKGLTPIKDVPLRVGTGLAQESWMVETRKLQKAWSELPEVFHPTDRVKPDWVKIEAKTPQAERLWGPLAGGWMEPHAFKELQAFTQPVERLPSMLEPLAKATSNIKVPYVAANVLTRIRNMTSNFLSLHLSGVPMYRVDLAMKAAKGLLSGSPWVQEAKAAGLAAGNEGSYFYRQYFEDVISQMAREHVSSLTEMPFRVSEAIARRATVEAPNKWVSLAGRSYEMDENFAKAIKYLHAREIGMTPKAAVAEANKWLLDYGDNTPFVNTMRRLPIPFITYPTKIAPLLIEGAAKRPIVMAQWKALLDSWNIAVAHQMGIPLETIRDMRDANVRQLQEFETSGVSNTMRQWMSNIWPLMIIPLKSPDGKWRPFYADVSGFTPVGQFINPRGLAPFGVNPIVNVIPSLLNPDAEGYHRYDYPDVGPVYAPPEPSPYDLETSPGAAEQMKISRRSRGAEAIKELAPFFPIGPLAPAFSGTGQRMIQAGLTAASGKSQMARDVLRYAYPSTTLKGGRSEGAPFPAQLAMGGLVGALHPLDPTAAYNWIRQREVAALNARRAKGETGMTRTATSAFRQMGTSYDAGEP